VIDTDAIAHQLTAPGGAAMPAIRAIFGDAVATADGALDRAAMRAIVFADPPARKRLEGILHPMIRAESERRLAGADSPYASSWCRCWSSPAATASASTASPWSTATRKPRSPASCSATAWRVPKSSASSPPRPRAEQRLEAADDVIDNDRSLADLEPQIERLHASYLALAG
jgi:dephospho-CoA kinase